MNERARLAVTAADVYTARRRIAGHVQRTPLVPAPALSRRLEASLSLKLDNMQDTGAFKQRGATNAVLNLAEPARAAGVVAVSTGNHGRAVAHAARQAGTRAVICLSKLVPEAKVGAIRDLGAEVRIHGDSQDEAEEEARRLVRDGGLTWIPPFDHPDVIAGQGTLGLEILEDAPDTEAILVPLSGGGLIAGIALVAKAINPAIRIIGISMDRGAAMIASLEAGRPVQVAEVPSLADSLGGGIGLDNAHTFPMVRALVDQLLVVSEDEIAEAMRALFFEERLVAEGACVVGLAAMMTGKLDLRGRRVVLPITGRNLDMSLFHRLMGGTPPATLLARG
jgi:threonine dehydratase